MEAVTYVRFDEEEQRVLAEALVGIRIGMEDPDTEVHASGPQKGKPTDEWRDVRALATVARGEHGSPKLLERAHLALSRMHSAAVEQSDVAWWEGKTPESPSDTDAAEVMAETRRRQADEAYDALSLVKDAMELAPRRAEVE